MAVQFRENQDDHRSGLRSVMSDNPAFLILRWQALTTRNGLRDLAERHKVDIVVTIFTLTVAGMYLAEAVMRNAAALRAAWPIVSIAALSASAALGAAAGWWTMGLTLRFAFAAWTIALPILVTARLMSAALAALAFGLVGAALLGIGVSFNCGLIGIEYPGIAGLLAAIIFVLGFIASLITRRWFITRTPLADGQSRDAEVLRRLRYASDGGRLPGLESGLFDMLARLDQATPRWIGRWVMDNRAVLRASADIAFLLGAAVLVAVASLMQGKAAPVSIFGALGGHAAFVFTLRGHPLASVILRVSPLQFAVALAGVVRLPLVISLGYFAPLALIGLVADPGALEPCRRLRAGAADRQRHVRAAAGQRPVVSRFGVDYTRGGLDAAAAGSDSDQRLDRVAGRGVFRSELAQRPAEISCVCLRARRTSY